MRKNSTQILTMITGVLTALVIVFSQFFFFQNASYSKKIVKTEKQEEKKNDAKIHISLPSFSQSSSTHAEIQTKSSSCLFEILFEEIKVKRHSVEIPLSSGKFFQTLFRAIIAPNAP